MLHVAANTVKFAYIDWTPQSIRPMRKALLSTHKSQVEAVLKPFHVSLQASNRNELGKYRRPSVYDDGWRTRQLAENDLRTVLDFCRFAGLRFD